MDDDEYIIDISTMDGYASRVTVNTSALSTNYNVDWSGLVDVGGITIIQPVEFEDEMPSVAKVEDMCRDYPALEKAYENFKTVYKLVRQDWQGKQDEES